MKSCYTIWCWLEKPNTNLGLPKANPGVPEIGGLDWGAFGDIPKAMQVARQRPHGLYRVGATPTILLPSWEGRVLPPITVSNNKTRSIAGSYAVSLYFTLVHDQHLVTPGDLEFLRHRSPAIPTRKSNTRCVEVSEQRAKIQPGQTKNGQETGSTEVVILLQTSQTRMEEIRPLALSLPPDLHPCLRFFVSHSLRELAA